MTIEEAAGLVLEAARLATRGAIFVLDMGEAVRIVDIVHAFAEQMHIPDVRIRYTGLRPGEKLTETLFSGHETYGRTVHPRILQAVNGHLDTDFWLRLADLSLAAANNDDRAVRRSLSTILPDYQPPPEYAATAPPTRYAVAY
jgi:FlaA1/EpsC-like NDP-sugar epimerase